MMDGPDVEEMVALVESLGAERGGERIAQLIFIGYLTEKLNHVQAELKAATEKLHQDQEMDSLSTVKEYTSQVRH